MNPGGVWRWQQTGLKLALDVSPPLQCRRTNSLGLSVLEMLTDASDPLFGAAPCYRLFSAVSAYPCSRRGVGDAATPQLTFKPTASNQACHFCQKQLRPMKPSAHLNLLCITESTTSARAYHFQLRLSLPPEPASSAFTFKS